MEILNAILQLPDRCLVNKRITKAFFRRNFDLTGREKALLDDAELIQSGTLFATISPGVNIPAITTGQMDWLEIQVIYVQTSAENLETNAPKIAHLFQKHIPYPLVLIVANDKAMMLNTADKSMNFNDANKRTLDSMYFSQSVPIYDKAPLEQLFTDSLAFPQLDKTNLQTCYNSFTQRIIALQAAAISGQYQIRTVSRTQQDLQRLEQLDALNKEVAVLEKQAKKEAQLNQRIQLNLQVLQKRQEIDYIKALISA